MFGLNVALPAQIDEDGEYKAFSADEVYAVDLERASVSSQPPFVNLQQFFVEQFLGERIGELAPAMLRWPSAT